MTKQTTSVDVILEAFSWLSLAANIHVVHLYNVYVGNTVDPDQTALLGIQIVVSSVVRLLDFHNRSLKIIVQEVSIDDRL